MRVASSERNAALPAHARFQKRFRAGIAAGRFTPGDGLPTEFEIARSFGTSRATVQLAMGRLMLNGLIERFRGRGTCVAAPSRAITISAGHTGSFEDAVQAAGGKVTYRHLAQAGARRVEDALRRSALAQFRLRVGWLAQARLRRADGALHRGGRRARHGGYRQPVLLRSIGAAAR
jgi:DNA-binding GntR family transcriptional regulator